MASAWIFPTSIYGQLSDVYGTAVTQYNTAPNLSGFPSGAGLILGQRGILFDFTETTMCSVGVGGAIQFAALTYTVGGSNAYTALIQTTTANIIPIVAVNDRAGSTALVANNYAWMTTRGLTLPLVAASQTAPKTLCSSTTTGQLVAVTAGTSTQFNIFQLNTTTTAGSTPCQIV